MAISFELNAEPRTDTGKGASRRLRHAGKVPAIMYGGGKDPESLMLSHNEVLRNLAHEAFYSHILTIKSGGTETSAILRDLQRHPSRPVILHMDLQRINAAEKLKTQSPVHVVGEDTSAAVKAGGLVSHDLTEVAIECLPKDLPEYLEIDISEMEVGDVKHLSDMKVPEGVTLSDLVRENDLAVVSIHAKRAEVEEDIAPVDEGAVEGGEESKADGEGEDS
ncbi:MAG: 50S ribosomal protein L25/general stress protein Ctc [Gammaproteobacteria bacterium]|nr:50S ribosomal protein L25/general stress protein Ctc [Gammaproteobacteria bacterium]